MRIKKKELLKELDANVAKKVQNTVANFEKETEVVDAAKDFKNSVKGIINEPVSDEIVNYLVNPKTTSGVTEEEEVKPKKRVKEVVKVKNLKK